MSLLDASFTEQEILMSTSQLPSEKVSGPHGFTCLFFKTYWQTIKKDVIVALNSIHSLGCVDLNLLNSASIILILKKEAEAIPDFWPIILIHAFAKKNTNKILALRLAPRMDELIAPCRVPSSKDVASMITSSTCATLHDIAIGKNVITTSKT